MAYNNRRQIETFSVDRTDNLFSFFRFYTITILHKFENFWSVMYIIIFYNIL